MTIPATNPRGRLARRLGVLALISLLATLIPLGQSPAAAEPLTVVVATFDDLSYEGLGLTSLRPIAGGYLIRTADLHATATLGCDGSAACDVLDGAIVSIDQRLGIVVVGDVLTPVVRGSTYGEITLGFGEVTLKKGFSGSLRGAAQCSTGSCDLAMVVSSAISGSSSLSLDLTALFTLDGGTGSWASIGGSGVARIVIDLIDAG